MNGLTGCLYLYLLTNRYMQIDSITTEYVDLIPKIIEEWKLYISERYNVSVHNCFCWCWEKVVLDLSRWIHVSADSFSNNVTVRPSVWNFNLPCKSHYFITNNCIKHL